MRFSVAAAFMGFLAALALPIEAHAQEKPIIALLFSSVSAPRSPGYRALRSALAEIGYIEGKNITYEYRSAETTFSRFPALADELIALRPTVLVTDSSMSTRALKEKTTTIPVIMVTVGDPVGQGLIESFARPGSNITGIAGSLDVIFAKKLQLLKELVPAAEKVVVLANASHPMIPAFLRDAEQAGGRIGIEVSPLLVGNPEELKQALAGPPPPGVQAILVATDSLMFGNRKVIIDFADRNRLPAMYTWRDDAVDGGLIAYGPDLIDQFRRAATYVDRILKGAKPANFPVEQPQQFNLILNLRTARALGIVVPPGILIAANEVIE